MKQITLPPGKYKLECWGAQGGYHSAATYTNKGNNKGGYSIGILVLNKSQILYLFAGGQGTNITASTSGKSGGWNGGASGGLGTNSSYGYGGAGGGGGSDIRIGSTSLYARVIVAGGGGGQGPGSTGGSTTNTSTILTSGTSNSYGGGLVGAKGTLIFQNNVQSDNNYLGAGESGSGGSQTTVGAGGSGGYRSTNSDGTYYPPGGSGGGGGWYGGGGGAGGGYNSGSSSVGSDGSPGSFGIGGAGGAGKSGYGYHAGVGGGGGGGSGYVYTSSTASNYPSGCLLNPSYYLADAQTIAGNTSFASLTGSTEIGHAGNGYVRITAIEAKNNLSIYIKNSTWKENNKILFKKTNWINHKDIYMKFNPQSLLPSGYTALEYIESTGTQYIDTDFKPKTTSRIQMRALPTKTVSTYTAFFGCRTASSPTASDSFSFAATTATTIRSDYFGTNQSATISTILSDTIIDKKQNILTAYGQTITNKAKTSEQSSTNNLTIFASNTVSKNEISYYISMKLYYCKIWDNGSLVRNLIPAKNTSGILGLYDIVNSVFYTNAGTGTFTAGPIATTSWVKIGSL